MSFVLWIVVLCMAFYGVMLLNLYLLVQIMAELDQTYELEQAHEQEYQPEQAVEVEHDNEQENEVEHAYENEVEHDNEHDNEVEHTQEIEVEQEHETEENEPEGDIPENLNPDEEQGLAVADKPVVRGGEKWPGWPGESIFRMLVPAQKVGSIIGRKGEYIKKTCEETKARIKILDGPPGTRERAVSKFLNSIYNIGIVDPNLCQR